MAIYIRQISRDRRYHIPVVYPVGRGRVPVLCGEVIKATIFAAPYAEPVCGECQALKIRKEQIEPGDFAQIVEHYTLPRNLEKMQGRIGKVMAVWETKRPPRLDVVDSSSRLIAHLELPRVGNTGQKIRRNVPVAALERLND